MKTCPQCNQVYYDDTNFCLNDGTTLVPASQITTAPQIEMPTVVRNAPVVIPAQQTFEAQSFQQPFQQQFATPVQPAAKGGGSGLVYAVLGFVLLLIVGAGVGLGIYFLRTPSNGSTEPANKPSTDSVAGGKTVTPTPEDKNKRDEIDEEKEKLKSEQQKLEEQKKKLDEEKKALEQQKKTPPPTPIQDNSRTAYIIDPPSNVRATPNGRIICVIRGIGTPIRILGSTGVRDNNGTWYVTDACGGRGVIHSTQIRF